MRGHRSHARTLLLLIGFLVAPGYCAVSACCAPVLPAQEARRAQPPARVLQTGAPGATRHRSLSICAAPRAPLLLCCHLVGYPSSGSLERATRPQQGAPRSRRPMPPTPSTASCCISSGQRRPSAACSYACATSVVDLCGGWFICPAWTVADLPDPAPDLGHTTHPQPNTRTKRHPSTFSTAWDLHADVLAARLPLWLHVLLRPCVGAACRLPPGSWQPHGARHSRHAGTGKSTRREHQPLQRRGASMRACLL